MMSRRGFATFISTTWRRRRLQRRLRLRRRRRIATQCRRVTPNWLITSKQESFRHPRNRILVRTGFVAKSRLLARLRQFSWHLVTSPYREVPPMRVFSERSVTAYLLILVQ